MAKNQKKYTPEFKQQLVNLYNNGGKSYPQLSNEYGVAKSTILGWVKELTQVKVSDTETISMKDYKVLQKKMHELETENEILKHLYTVKQMCTALKFPKSTYYKALVSGLPIDRLNMKNSAKR